MKQTLSRTMFQVITTGMQWSDVDAIVEKCDESDFWSEEFLAKALENAKRSEVRHLMKSLKDDEGMPIFHSVERTDPETGESRRVYMQEVLFNPDDYRTVIEYHMYKATYHEKIARKLDERCRNQYRMSFLPGFAETAA